MENDPVLIFAVIIVLIIFTFLSVYFSKAAIIKRKLENGELKLISDFKDDDIAKIKGKVELVGKPIKAPLSERSCAHYYIIVEERVRSGRSTSWKTIIEDERSTKFVIRDSNGIAHINDKKIESYIVQDREFESGFGNDATELLKKYLKKHDVDSETMFGFNKTIRYKEGILEHGEIISVYGRGVWRNAEDLSLPTQYGRILVLENSVDSSIYLSDDPDTLT